MREKRCQGRGTIRLTTFGWIGTIADPSHTCKNAKPVALSRSAFGWCRTWRQSEPHNKTPAPAISMVATWSWRLQQPSPSSCGMILFLHMCIAQLRHVTSLEHLTCTFPALLRCTYAYIRRQTSKTAEPSFLLPPLSYIIDSSPTLPYTSAQTDLVLLYHITKSLVASLSLLH